MIIGIDISQTAYPNTGVSNYLKLFVMSLLKYDKTNNYILFFSSLRQKIDVSFLKGINNSRVEVKIFHFPQTFLNFVWNKMHVFPVEKLIGKIDLFISSDWVEPPTESAKKATILYDLIVNKYPNETDQKIVITQTRRLGWVKSESDVILCISQSTANDAMKTLGIKKNKLKVIYPGI